MRAVKRRKPRKFVDKQFIDFRQYFKDRNLKASDVAYKLGYSKQAFNYMLNKNDMDISIFIQLAGIMGRTPWQLIKLLHKKYNCSHNPYEFKKRKGRYASAP